MSKEEKSILQGCVKEISVTMYEHDCGIVIVQHNLREASRDLVAGRQSSFK